MGPSASFGLQAVALTWFENDAPGFGLSLHCPGEIRRVLLNDIEGIVVDRDNHLGLDEFDCPQGVFGPHSVVHGMFRGLPGRYSSPESRFRFPEPFQVRQWPKVPKMGLQEPKSDFPL